MANVNIMIKDLPRTTSVDTSDDFVLDQVDATRVVSVASFIAATGLVNEDKVSELFEDYLATEVVPMYNGTIRSADETETLTALGKEERKGANLSFDLTTGQPLLSVDTCRDITTLRSTKGNSQRPFVSVREYNTGSRVGGGLYKFDPTDTTTSDDGVTCIVSSTGDRFKPVLEGNVLPASRAGMATGLDVTPIWKVFCQAPFDKLIDTDIYVSGVGILADRTNISSAGKGTIYLTASVSDQVTPGNEGSCLEAGNGSIVKGLRMYGQNFNGAGVFIGGKTGVIVRDCEMKDSYAIGVKNYMSTGTMIFNNHIHSNRHGVLSQQSVNTLVHSNFVHNISWTTGNNGGGIWTSSDINFFATGNIVGDCADVGLDFEGGNQNRSDGNIVYRCRNGELTFFGSSTGLTGVPVMGKNSHRNNLVIRENYANNKDGVAVNNALTDAAGCVVYGTLDVIQDGELSFEDNNIFSISTTGVSLFCFRSRTSDPAANCRISFRSNKFVSYSGYMGTLLDRQDLTFEDNKLYFKGGTVRTTELRDHRTMNYRNNSHDIAPGVVTGNNVMMISTAIAVAAGRLSVSKNSFAGYDGIWIYIDQINSGRSVILDDNDFADETGYTVIPVSIGTGGVIWKNSRIRLFRPTGAAVNFAGVGVLYQSSFVCMDATAWIMLNSKVKCGYRFALKCDKSDTMYLGAIDAGGAINTGRFPDPTSYATFTGNTISFTTTGSATLSAIVNLNLDSIPTTA